MTAPKLTEMRRMMSIEELAEEDHRGEMIRKATRLIQIARLLGGVSGAKGDDPERRHGEGLDYFFALLVVIILTGIGLLSVVQRLWYTGRKWWRNLE